jgi:hypothetical protein
MAVRPLRPVTTRQGITTQTSWAAIAAALLMLSSLGSVVTILIQGFNAELAVAAGATALWSVTFAILALGDDG